MAVNKVVYGTTVLVDLTEDTVTPQTLLLGNRAHGRDGQVVNGTLTGSATGILVKIPGISATYVSATSIRLILRVTQSAIGTLRGLLTLICIIRNHLKSQCYLIQNHIFLKFRFRPSFLRPGRKYRGEAGRRRRPA